MSWEAPPRGFAAGRVVWRDEDAHRPQSTDVLIVGGGIVGAACAYELSLRGAEVTIIDRGEMGYGCSYGNAGWIAPFHALPLPMPGTLRKAGRWLLDPESPLYIKPRLSWDLLCWLSSFARNTTQTHMRHAARALNELATPSSVFYRDFAASCAKTLGYQQRGILSVSASEHGLEAQRREMQFVGQLGISGEVLDEHELREMEPALTGDVVGGVYYRNEAQAEPLRMVQALILASAEHGAQILPRTEVLSFKSDGRRIKALDTTRGHLGADQIVLAAGSWSSQLGRKLQLRVPIQAGKGYAIIIDPIEPMPRRPLLLDETKIAATPRQGSLRLAGTMELAGMDESVTRRRVEAILKGGRRFLAIPSSPHVVEIWRGLRPCTPDGLPIIGRPAQWENLVLAAGHAMLGLTLAPATAFLVADMLTGSHGQIDPEPFDPARF